MPAWSICSVCPSVYSVCFDGLRGITSCLPHPGTGDQRRPLCGLELETCTCSYMGGQSRHGNGSSLGTIYRVVLMYDTMQCIRSKSTCRCRCGLSTSVEGDGTYFIYQKVGKERKTCMTLNKLVRWMLTADSSADNPANSGQRSPQRQVWLAFA